MNTLPRSAHIANCLTCTLANAMKDCRNCGENVGLLARMMRHPFDHSAAEEFEAIARIAREIGVTAVNGTPKTNQFVGELGTCFTVSGGEVMELDAHLEARYEEMTDSDPF